METSLFDKAIAEIDNKNAKDPNKELYKNIEHPKELLYAQRMSEKLLEFNPNASEQLQIAARAQHICRWEIPRSDYPMNKVGYLKWREELKKRHAETTSSILSEIGFDSNFSDRVSFLILKKGIKRDEESQCLEDVICLVFLQYYFEEFSLKYKEDKIKDIVKKTWRKMSEKGHEAALKLNFSEKSLTLIKQAIS